MAIAVPEADGLPPLPNAEAEAVMVAAAIPGRAVTLVGPQAAREAVLAALPSASVAHFACHATSDFTDPSASCLALSDGPLSVLGLGAIRAAGARMAYLSACGTASGGALVDEAIHLSSAFQLAGYRHLIGTLWPIADDLAQQVARDVYADLATDSTTCPPPCDARPSTCDNGIRGTLTPGPPTCTWVRSGRAVRGCQFTGTCGTAR